jgi:hypothetical protein
MPTPHAHALGQGMDALLARKGNDGHLSANRGQGMNALMAQWECAKGVRDPSVLKQTSGKGRQPTQNEGHCAPQHEARDCNPDSDGVSKALELWVTITARNARDFPTVSTEG